MRENPLFLRNNGTPVGKWGIPLIRKQSLDCSGLSLIACSDTRAHDKLENCRKGVHFFVDDYRFIDIYNHPERSLLRYSQYAFLLSPDFSVYADMNPWRQMESVAMNRWVGSYWQEHGLTVIPSVSWGTPRSFEFCFDGIEENSMVAVGMIGCKRDKSAFLRGYDAMLERLRPAAIIVFGIPFPEMTGNIVTVDYWKSRKVVR